MLSYREDNKKRYVNKGNEWDAIGSEKEVRFELSLKIVLSSDHQIGWTNEANKITSGVLRPFF